MKKEGGKEREERNGRNEKKGGGKGRKERRNGRGKEGKRKGRTERRREREKEGREGGREEFSFIMRGMNVTEGHKQEDVNSMLLCRLCR